MRGVEGPDVSVAVTVSLTEYTQGRQTDGNSLQVWSREEPGSGQFRSLIRMVAPAWPRVGNVNSSKHPAPSKKPWQTAVPGNSRHSSAPMATSVRLCTAQLPCRKSKSFIPG